MIMSLHIYNLQSQFLQCTNSLRHHCCCCHEMSWRQRQTSRRAKLLFCSPVLLMKWDKCWFMLSWESMVSTRACSIQERGCAIHIQCSITQSAVEKEVIEKENLVVTLLILPQNLHFYLCPALLMTLFDLSIGKASKDPIYKAVWTNTFSIRWCQESWRLNYLKAAQSGG